MCGCPSTRGLRGGTTVTHRLPFRKGLAQGQAEVMRRCQLFSKQKSMQENDIGLDMQYMEWVRWF